MKKLYLQPDTELAPYSLIMGLCSGTTVSDNPEIIEDEDNDDPPSMPGRFI